MEARHFTALAVCAVRYALGRMTYVSFSVPEAIRANLELVETKGLFVIIRDIEDFRRIHGRIGMDCDDACWQAFKECCEKELRDRQREPDAITARKFMEKDPETLKALGIFD